MVRAVQLLAHKKPLLEVLQGLKRLALLLHRGIHLVMLPEPPLEVFHLVGCKPHLVRHSPVLVRPNCRISLCFFWN